MRCLLDRQHRLAQLSSCRPCSHRPMIYIQYVLSLYHFRHRLLRWLDNPLKRPSQYSTLCKDNYSKDSAKELKIL
jgi:hypothetical protein